jgi:hypothetical protein
MTVLELINNRWLRWLKECNAYGVIRDMPQLSKVTPWQLKIGSFLFLTEDYKNMLTKILCDIYKPHFIRWIKLIGLEDEVKRVFDGATEWHYSRSQCFKNFDDYLNNIMPQNYVLNLCSWGQNPEVSWSKIDRDWRAEIERFAKTKIRF